MPHSFSVRRRTGCYVGFLKPFPVSPSKTLSIEVVSLLKADPVLLCLVMSQISGLSMFPLGSFPASSWYGLSRQVIGHLIRALATWYCASC